MTIGEYGIIGGYLTDKQANRAHDRLRSWSDDLGVSWAHKDYDQCNVLHLKIWAYCESLLDMDLITVQGCEHMKKFWSMTWPEKIMKEYTRHE